MYKISITGKANSGKDTTAKLIAKSLVDPGDTVKFLAFADPIKKMAKVAFPQIPNKWLYGSSRFRSNVIPNAFKDGIPLTVRQLLIDLGNDFGRKYNEKHWINNYNCTFNKLKNTAAIITADCRMMNEFEYLKSLNFFTIKLSRDMHTKIDNVSETEQDGIKDDQFDHIIYNNGSLDDLKALVESVVLKLKII